MSLLTLLFSFAALVAPHDDVGGLALERVSPHLRFERPVFVTGAGDGSGRLFVVEQAGVVRSFVPGADPTSSDVFLDIRDRVGREGNEEGLIGLAFSPDFADDGRVFVHYTARGGRPVNRLSRFEVDPLRPNALDAAGEQLLLEVPQPYRNHNGGMLAFGPDGMLYVSLGDGGAADDPHGHGQDLTTLLGSILRLDVSGDGYRVPRDNPFVTSATSARPEIWAYGLRNVWRFSFDRETGELWAGDVGQRAWEEVGVIERGGNHGWRAREGFEVFDEEVVVNGPLVEPAATYGRELGASVTGGYVYRGQRFPELRGAYVFADYVSGNVWRLDRDADGEAHATLALRSGKSIASFGEDDDGELYAVSFDGALSRVVPSAELPTASLDWPGDLSQTGLFDVIVKRVMREGALAYELDTPGWADGARVSRHVLLPDGAKLGYRADGPWELPVGARVVQTFTARDGRGERPLETRLVIRTDDGWEAGSYVWRRNARDGQLAPEGRQFERRDPERGVVTWHVPSSSECGMCHHADQGFVLGLTTAQLGLEQVRAWRDAGVVDVSDAELAAAPAALSSPRADETPVAAAARAALDVHCAHCHRPSGPGNASFDVRRDVPLAATRLVDAWPMHGTFGLNDARLVAPGRPDASIVVHRVETLGDGRMPHVASQVVDDETAAALRAWITELGERRRR